MFARGNGMKKYGAYLAVLGSLVVLVLAVAGAYSEFLTVRAHERDLNLVQTDMAAMQRQIRLDSIQDRIRWLSEWIADVEKEYGDNCARCSGRIKEDWDIYTQELKELRETLKKLKEKMGIG